MAFSSVSPLVYAPLYYDKNLNSLGCSLGASGTLAMNQKAKALGPDVISLSLGEPDLPPPSWALEGVSKALDNKEYRYTATSGLLPLRQCIVDSFHGDSLKKPLSHLKENPYKSDNVLVTTGAKQALFNTLAVTLNPQDKILLPRPYWVSYGPMAHMAGGSALELHTGKNHKICPQHLQEVLRQEKNIKWMVFSSPSNPSGTVYDYQELKAILDVLKDHPNVFVLWDAIYQKLSFDNKPVYHPLDIDPSFVDRLIFVDGPSKSLSMTGWRLGWAMGPQNIIEAMERYQSHSTSNACSLTQYGCLAALQHPEYSDFLEKRRQLFQQRRDFFCHNLQEIFGDTMDFEIPQGAFYVFADVSVLMAQRGFKSAMDLAMNWLETLLISSVPGDEFGKKNSLRFSFSLGEDKIQEAANRWKKWMQ